MIITRHYSGKLYIKFLPETIIPDVSPTEFILILRKINDMVKELIAPEGKGEALGNIKTNLTQFLDNEINLYNNYQKTYQINDSEVNDVITRFHNNCNEQWAKDLLNDPINELKTLTPHYVGNRLNPSRVSRSRTFLGISIIAPFSTKSM